MSDWITDRRPTKEDAPYGKLWVMQYDSVLLGDWQYVQIREGMPWMPITTIPEPYVKPKRYGVRETYHGSGKFAVYDSEDGLTCSSYLPTREAAERIAAIYEEVMP